MINSEDFGQRRPITIFYFPGNAFCGKNTQQLLLKQRRMSFDSIVNPRLRKRSARDPQGILSNR
ncbi:MAG: hypothetical protein ACLSA6_03715 [Holdemania massiliensis]